MSKRVLGPGASCCGEDCDLGCGIPTTDPSAVDESTEDLDLFDEEDDE